MERQHPADYERVRQSNQPERDALVVKPARMTEQEWMTAFNQQTADEVAQELKATVRLTHEFIDLRETVSS